MANIPRKLKLTAYFFIGLIGLNGILKFVTEFDIITSIDDFDPISWAIILSMYEFVSIIVAAALGAIFGFSITKRYG